MNLTVEIGRLKLKNPVMSASGTFGYAEEFSDFVDLNKLGAIVVKGISIKPMEGNPPPRICETACGMLNSIGLQNVGLKKFLKEKLPYLNKLKTIIIVNILGNSISDYVKLSKTLEDSGIEAVELNVSCPNVKKGGISFGINDKMLAKLISKVRQSAQKITLITKLSPNVSNIPLFAKVAEDSGSDAISLINTIPALAIDIETWKPKLANITGGLSGPAIKPIALRMVWEAAETVKIPVIGIGGIMNAGDAIEFLLAGATAIQVGTGNFVNPGATIDILEGIEDYLKRKSINDIKGIIGGMNGKCTNNNSDN
ncbi:MAG: dihydroorotate dehydrogenase [Nitrospirae bacterium]|jgi:dihydroorotate dehydrogenase (NAD+) catalytic subunit|nr:dihydroorotate dehydrogenase [Nitrospirota bacterium]